MTDEEINTAMREVIPLAGPLGFHLAKAIEEINSLRRALQAERDHIKEIREIVGQKEE